MYGFAVSGAVIFIALFEAAFMIFIMLPILCILLLLSFEGWRAKKLTREGKIRAAFPHRTLETPPEQPGTWRLRWPRRSSAH